MDHTPLIDELNPTDADTLIFGLIHEPERPSERGPEEPRVGVQEKKVV